MTTTTEEWTRTIRDDEVWEALHRAALTAHPDWERTEVLDPGCSPDEDGSWTCRAGGIPAASELVAWFKRSFPMQAKAIEDAISINNGVTTERRER